MALTFIDLCDELKKLDETTLLELLNISSEEIINKFQDKIEDNFDHLLLLIEENQEEGLYNYDEWITYCISTSYCSITLC